MTVKELAKLVGEMRASQRAYFRDRGQARLAVSKHLERRVDDAIEGILEPSLFDAHGEEAK